MDDPLADKLQIKLKRLENENKQLKLQQQQQAAAETLAPEPEADEGRQRILDDIRKYEALQKLDIPEFKEEAATKLATLRAELQSAKPPATVHAQAHRRLGKAKKAMEDLEVTIALQQVQVTDAQMALDDSMGQRASLAADIRKFQDDFTASAKESVPRECFRVDFEISQEQLEANVEIKSMLESQTFADFKALLAAKQPAFSKPTSSSKQPDAAKGEDNKEDPSMEIDFDSPDLDLDNDLAKGITSKRDLQDLLVKHGIEAHKRRKKG